MPYGHNDSKQKSPTIANTRVKGAFMNKKNIILMILDGYGLTDETRGNAIAAAKTPNLDKLFKDYPWAPGSASGLDVGLPDGQMGNSEVGHMNIGAGRIVYQDLTRITKSISDGDFFQNKALLAAVENCKKHNSALHIWGLTSDGGVHSHTEHLFAIVDMAARNSLDKVYVHCIFDGRDTAPKSGMGFLKELQQKLSEVGNAKIASLHGRYYIMDRDNRWERVEKAYQVLVEGEGEVSDCPAAYLQKSYDDGITDEFIIPCVITEGGAPIVKVCENDSVIFYNFRPDRAREITRAFVDPEFDGFKRGKGFFPLHYVCFTEYDKSMPNVSVAFEPQNLENTLGEYISELGMTQLRIAETEKYAHVTFFFNGGVEDPYKGEDRVLIPSPKVATYDLAPEMSAKEVTDELIERIKSRKYDLIIVNYANPDMMGHTGVFEATVKGVEVVDECVGRVMEAVLETDASMFLCADHGNPDKMLNLETNEPFTAHTTNPVPFVIINYTDAVAVKEDGKLCDIAPTILDMMGIDKPKEMTGQSLLIK